MTDKPEIDFPDSPPPTELVITEIAEGDGAEATAGSTVVAHYVGVAHSSGEEFDASYSRGEPLSFRLGVGQVISGWDQGIQGMKVGGPAAAGHPAAPGVRRPGCAAGDRRRRDPDLRGGPGRRPLKRIFAALSLPPEVETHLDDAVDGVRTAHPELRWVKPSRWHLTCEFLGECGPHEVDRQLGRWERRAARSHPLTLRLAGAGCFPAKAWMARVLWIGLDGDVDGWTRLAAYGQDPHLTVARTRERTDVTGLVAELSSYAGPTWTADEVVVFESFLPGKAGGSSRRRARRPFRQGLGARPWPALRPARHLPPRPALTLPP